MYIPENIKAGLLEALRSSEQGDTPSSGPALLFRKNSQSLVAGFKPIRNTREYFASKKGWVFTIQKGQEIILPVTFKGKKNPYVEIPTIGVVPLIYILMDAFQIKYSPSDRLTYTVNFKGHIDLQSIKVTRIEPSDFSKDESALIEKYGCHIKASSANSRGEGILSPLEVYFCIKHFEFKCFYCGTLIDYKNWHLDHYKPIAKGGENSFVNIVPSCPTCNKMKSDILPHNFLKMCHKIVKNSKIPFYYKDK